MHNLKIMWLFVVQPHIIFNSDHAKAVKTDTTTSVYITTNQMRHWTSCGNHIRIKSQCYVATLNQSISNLCKMNKQIKPVYSFMMLLFWDTIK